MSTGSNLPELVVIGWSSGVMGTSNGLYAAETFRPSGNINLSANDRNVSQAAIRANFLTLPIDLEIGFFRLGFAMIDG